MKQAAYVVTTLCVAIALSSCASTQDHMTQQQSKQTLKNIAQEQSDSHWEETKVSNTLQDQSRSLQNMRPKDGGTKKDN